MKITQPQKCVSHPSYYPSKSSNRRNSPRRESRRESFRYWIIIQN